MRARKMLLSRLLVAFVSVIIADIGTVEAAQVDRSMNVSALANPKPTPAPIAAPTPPQNSKPKAKTASKQASPIVGELDDNDTTPIEDEEDDSSADEDAPPPKSKKTKLLSNLDKENAKVKKRDKRKEKLIEGFSKAEDFHKMWFNLSSAKIKLSLENLTKFCKVACTKKQCMDAEVANNCHLMCPHATTKQCPDPLKQSGDDADTDEVTLGSEEASRDAPFPPDDPKGQNTISSDVISSIERADRNIVDDEGEGG